MKKHRKTRRERKKQRKLIILSMVSLLCIMSAGYAAFQTHLNIAAKGNIKDYNAAQQLKKKVISVGDGLYEDIYEENRYIYRGSNPNNYIKFNNELWRIISIESDDTLKITKKDILSTGAFDSNNSNDWNKPASVNTYLNNQYYNNLPETEKQVIVSHNFYYGTIILSDSFKQNLEQIKTKTWNGKIGLITIGDFFKASNYEKCTPDINDSGLGTSPSDNFKCHNNNYLFKNKNYWSLNANNQSSYWVTIVASNGAIGNGSAYINDSVNIIPVTHLKQNIKLTGEGTESNPYIIKNA